MLGRLLRVLKLRVVLKRGRENAACIECAEQPLQFTHLMQGPVLRGGDHLLAGPDRHREWNRSYIYRWDIGAPKPT